MSSMHKLCKKKIKIHTLTPTINAVYKFHKKMKVTSINAGTLSWNHSLRNIYLKLFRTTGINILIQQNKKIHISDVFFN